ncbi:MAG: hypothetical protein AAF433_14110 [Bacteroidota bacterium]
MKSPIAPLFLLLLCLISLGCGPQRYMTTISPDKDIDQRLVGVWAGSEEDQEYQGLHKSWVMTREADGSFVLDFQVSWNGGPPEQVIKTGRWWIQDGRFHEYHDSSGATDIYEYEPLSKEQILFRASAMASGNNDYKFIDSRIPSAN